MWHVPLATTCITTISAISAVAAIAAAVAAIAAAVATAAATAGAARSGVQLFVDQPDTTGTSYVLGDDGVLSTTSTASHNMWSAREDALFLWTCLLYTSPSPRD